MKQVFSPGTGGYKMENCAGYVQRDDSQTQCNTMYF